MIGTFFINEIGKTIESLKKTSAAIRSTAPEVADEVDGVIQIGEIYIVRLITNVWPR